MIELDARVLAEIVLRASLVYLALLLLLRLAGKRELGQMNIFDLVVVLIIANAVQNAMVGPDTSLTGGLVAAATLVVVNGIVNRLDLRVRWFRRELIGEPTLLVHNGDFIGEHLRREGIAVDEVMMALREHGLDALSDVRSAVLEVDGTISIVPRDAPVHRTRRPVRGNKKTG